MDNNIKIFQLTDILSHAGSQKHDVNDTNQRILTKLEVTQQKHKHTSGVFYFIKNFRDFQLREETEM